MDWIKAADNKHLWHGTLFFIMFLKNIALIPARSGSKRLPGKNTKKLLGVPLIAFSINAAIETNQFAEIIVSTDSEHVASVAREFGAMVPMLRPTSISTDESSDIDWINHALVNMVQTPLDTIGCIAILRPTNPLRTAKSISKAIELLDSNPWADSLRAMEPTDKHPGKMWLVNLDNEAFPFVEQKSGEIPTHDRPTQTLQKVWVQNASLEVVKIQALFNTNTISGKRVVCFELPGYEGFDINTQKDWDLLVMILERDKSILAPHRKLFERLSINL